MNVGGQGVYTPEEYLALELVQEHKSEYWDGEVSAMSGFNLEHCTLTVNLLCEIGSQLQNTQAEVYGGTMLVATKDLRFFFHPDLSVVCDKPVFYREDIAVLMNPAAIVEVLSPSTEALDRGRKFLQYQCIESLTDYVLIAQDEARVEHFTKQKDGSWNLRIVSGLKSKLRIASIDCTLSLAELYDRIKFTDEGRSVKRQAIVKSKRSAR
jgi:Uma2 family endonuclease